MRYFFEVIEVILDSPSHVSAFLDLAAIHLRHLGLMGDFSGAIVFFEPNRVCRLVGIDASHLDSQTRSVVCICLTVVHINSKVSLGHGGVFVLGVHGSVLHTAIHLVLEIRILASLSLLLFSLLPLLLFCIFVYIVNAVEDA